MIDSDDFECKYHKVFFVSMVLRGKIVRLSLLCKINWVDPRFHSVFNFSDLLIWIKLRKVGSTPLPSTSATCGLGHLWFIWVFSADLCSVMCVNRNRQIEVFLYLSRGDFLEIGVFYSIFEHIRKKNLFWFLHLISGFPCYIRPLSFPDSSLTKFRGKKRNVVNTNVDPKTMKSFSLLQSIIARILQNGDRFYRICRENSGKIQFARKKTNSFPSVPTVFVRVKIVPQIKLHFFILFWLASGGGPKLKIWTTETLPNIYHKP